MLTLAVLGVMLVVSALAARRNTVAVEPAGDQPGAVAESA
jgi:hypothetical protein